MTFFDTFHIPSYFIGMIAGAIAAIVGSGPWSHGYSDLDNCAKTHNVYQCEMVAVPKTGEK